MIRIEGSFSGAGLAVAFGVGEAAGLLHRHQVAGLGIEAGVDFPAAGDGLGALALAFLGIGVGGGVGIGGTEGIDAVVLAVGDQKILAAQNAVVSGGRVGNELQAGGSAGDYAVELLAAGTHGHLQFVGREHVGIAGVARGRGQGFRNHHAVAGGGNAEQDAPVVAHLEIQIHTVTGDGGLRSGRIRHQAGVVHGGDMLYLAVVVAIHEELGGGVGDLAAVVILGAARVEGVHVADLVVLQLDQRGIAFHHGAFPGQFAPRWEFDGLVVFVKDQAAGFNRHRPGARALRLIVNLDVLFHAQFVRGGIVVRAGGLATAVLKSEGGGTISFGAVGFGIESDAGGMDDHRGALGRAGRRKIQRDLDVALGIEPMLGFVKLGVGRIDQVVGVVLLTGQAQLHALEVDAGGILDLAEVLGGNIGPHVAGFGVGFHPVPELGAGVQIVGKILGPGRRVRRGRPFLRAIGENDAAEDGGDRQQQEPAWASHGDTFTIACPAGWGMFESLLRRWATNEHGLRTTSVSVFSRLFSRRVKKHRRQRPPALPVIMGKS